MLATHFYQILSDGTIQYTVYFGLVMEKHNSFRFRVVSVPVLLLMFLPCKKINKEFSLQSEITFFVCFH
jgi:hypothetical protein